MLLLNLLIASAAAALYRLPPVYKQAVMEGCKIPLDVFGAVI